MTPCTVTTATGGEEEEQEEEEDCVEEEEEQMNSICTTTTHCCIKIFLNHKHVEIFKHVTFSLPLEATFGPQEKKDNVPTKLSKMI